MTQRMTFPLNFRASFLGRTFDAFELKEEVVVPYRNLHAATEVSAGKGSTGRKSIRNGSDTFTIGAVCQSVR